VKQDVHAVAREQPVEGELHRLRLQKDDPVACGGEQKG